jgi:hypothetical protein
MRKRQAMHTVEGKEVVVGVREVLLAGRSNEAIGTKEVFNKAEELSMADIKRSKLRLMFGRKLEERQLDSISGMKAGSGWGKFRTRKRHVYLGAVGELEHAATCINTAGSAGFGLGGRGDHGCTGSREAEQERPGWVDVHVDGGRLVGLRVGLLDAEGELVPARAEIGQRRSRSRWARHVGSAHFRDMKKQVAVPLWIHRSDESVRLLHSQHHPNPLPLLHLRPLSAPINSSDVTFCLTC